MDQFRFPDNFLFGVATSAAQVEGATLEDGRGSSIWDVMAEKPGRISDGTTPAVTCDEYHRYREDVGLMKQLHVNSYRFSFSWSRILPEGRGSVNQKGLDYYKRLLDELDAAGIIPNATIYHWDLPHALDQKDGWCNRDVVGWYADYASLLFREFGDRIPLWATMNEPIATYLGYSGGHLAPGRGEEASGRQANHNLLLAHGEGVRRFRQENLRGSQIGIVVDIWHHHPLRPDCPADAALAELENEKTYRSYLDPIFKGVYSPALLEYMERNRLTPEIRPGDMESIREKLDFFGLNCYNRVVDCADKEFRMKEAAKSLGGNFQDDASEFYPKAMYDAVQILKDRYHLDIPIYITENGTFNCAEELCPDGRIHDAKRIAYLEGFLRWTAKAMKEGANIRGYYVWSLMDNWEWSAGESYRYGLYHTDFRTQKRVPKDSAVWYREVCATRQIDIQTERT